MKAQLGRPTGLALALLATLLATFLAMGVFSVALANEHSATRTFSATTVAPGAEITVDIALSAYGDGGSVAENAATGFQLCLRLRQPGRLAAALSAQAATR